MSTIKPVALLVEDRPEVAAIWARYLANLKMEVKWATSMAQAIEMSDEIPPPSLLLLDLVLPDSREAEATLINMKRLTRGNPDCAIIVISGFVTPEIASLAIMQGAHRVMEKLDVSRAQDLWLAINSTIAKGPKGFQACLENTRTLIDKLMRVAVIALMFSSCSNRVHITIEDNRAAVQATKRSDIAITPRATPSFQNP